MFLYNRVNKLELKERLLAENFSRRTLSFYRYFTIGDPCMFRDELFLGWSELDCLGRIYVAHEGINAQMSVPEQNLDEFLAGLELTEGLGNMPVKYAIEDNGKSFYKLTIKVREKIVADGFAMEAYDFTNVGEHLSAEDFHRMLDAPDTLVVDIRNHYEYEVGHFVDALNPEAGTFREAILNAVQMLGHEKDKNILLYCTGGIRCEKASAYFRHRGFDNVFQLHGGIIEYAQRLKQLGIEPKFTGKNFVFDERLGESIDGKVIAHCHQCDAPCDTHTNCANDDCHQLFIQCEDCRSAYEGCCCVECMEVLHMPEDEKLNYRLLNQDHYSRSKIYNRIGESCSL